MGSREELATILRNNKQLAALNPGVVAEVMVPSKVRANRFPELTLLGEDGPIPEAITFTVPGDAVAKPRMTQSDKWKKRPSVVKYRSWSDLVGACCSRAIGRRFAGTVLRSYFRIRVICYFQMPRSWNEKTKASKKGCPHDLKPDADNILKGCVDSLFPTGDSQIYDMHITKLWADDGGPRTQITLY